MTAAVRDSSTHDSAKSPAAPLVPLRARARSGPIAPHLHRLPIVYIRGNPVFWMGIIKRQMGPLLRLWRASDAVGACRSFLLVISALSVLVSGEKKRKTCPALFIHLLPIDISFVSFPFFSTVHSAQVIRWLGERKEKKIAAAVRHTRPPSAQLSTKAPRVTQPWL